MGDVRLRPQDGRLLLPSDCIFFTVHAPLYFLIYHGMLLIPSRVYRLCPVSRTHGALEEAH